MKLAEQFYSSFGLIYNSLQGHTRNKVREPAAIRFAFPHHFVILSVMNLPTDKKQRYDRWDLFGNVHGKDKDMLIDLVRKNRSFRGYDHSRKISEEELLAMVEAARLCPSSVNMQPLKYYLAFREDTVNTIQKQTKWAKGLPEMTLPHEGKEPTAFIVICQDTKINENLNRFHRDIGIVAHTILLTATEMGLGGCMIGNFDANAVQGVLGLEENLRPMLIVAIGKPDEDVILTDVVDGKTAYYRDEKDRHYVPKRALEDLVMGDHS